MRVKLNGRSAWYCPLIQALNILERIGKLTRCVNGDLKPKSFPADIALYIFLLTGDLVLI